MVYYHIGEDMTEEFRQCFENYEISNLGNCRKKTGGSYRVIKGSMQNRGYLYFQVQRDGKRINKLFHHLVAEQFIGERPPAFVIDHIDRNKLNNNVENLRYCTQGENMRNTDYYRSDITTSGVERLREFQKEQYRKHKDPSAKTYRVRGSGSIVNRENGTFSGVININKIRYKKTFKTLEEAEAYLKAKSIAQT